MIGGLLSLAIQMYSLIQTSWVGLQELTFILGLKVGVVHQIPLPWIQQMVTQEASIVTSLR